MNRFTDKNVLVTGAAAGIGRATALQIAAEGGLLAVADVDDKGLARTVALVEKAGGKALAIHCDLGDPQEVESCVAETVKQLGSLHVLCNVGGVLFSSHTHELPLDDWERVIRINLTGTFLMCRAAIPHLLKTKGAIVNTASTAALGGHPWMAAYSASKGGVLALSRSLALEYVKQGLRVNAVCPGGIKTDMHNSFSFPEGADPKLLRAAIGYVEMAEPSAVATAIAFLASDDAGYITGEQMRVDGGALA